MMENSSHYIFLAVQTLKMVDKQIDSVESSESPSLNEKSANWKREYSAHMKYKFKYFNTNHVFFSSPEFEAPVPWSENWILYSKTQTLELNSVPVLILCLHFKQVSLRKVKNSKRMFCSWRSQSHQGIKVKSIFEHFPFCLHFSQTVSLF